MNYIIFDEINPKEAVKIYSSELYKISRPVNDPDDITKYLFDWIIHPVIGDVALCVDLDYMLPVHHEKDISVLAQMLNSKVTEIELKTLVDYVNKQGKVKFRDIIPSTMHIYSREDLEKNGWFPELE